MNGHDKSKKLDLLRFLIEDQKMDVNQHGKWPNGTTGSFTPLMLAIASSNFEDDDFAVLEYLLEQGGDMNSRIFYILHDERKYVLHNSVLSWAIEKKVPYHVIHWLEKHGQIKIL